MSWLALDLEVDGAAVESFSDAMLELGADSVTIEPAPVSPPSRELEEAQSARWPRNRVRAIVPPQTDAGAFVCSAAEVAGLPAVPSFAVHPIAAEDWVRRTQSQFGPLRIGERLWVVPSWGTPPSNETAVVLRLDPGLAFGTGTHATTALCLEWLDSAVLRGKFVLDYGCGSGVLAIAALRLGAAAALAIDIDPQALIATRENAARNQVSDRLTIATPADAPRGQGEILLANILAEPLMELAPSLAERVVPGGSIVLSGILRSQATPVASRYAAWFDMAPTIFRDDWALLNGVRRL